MWLSSSTRGCDGLDEVAVVLVPHHEVHELLVGAVRAAAAAALAANATHTSQMISYMHQFVIVGLYEAYFTQDENCQTNLNPFHGSSALKQVFIDEKRYNRVNLLIFCMVQMTTKMKIQTEENLLLGAD